MAPSLWQIARAQCRAGESGDTKFKLNLVSPGRIISPRISMHSSTDQKRRETAYTLRLYSHVYAAVSILSQKEILLPCRHEFACNIGGWLPYYKVRFAFQGWSKLLQSDLCACAAGAMHHTCNFQLFTMRCLCFILLIRIYIHAGL